MEDIYVIYLIAFAMTGPLGAIRYEKKTKKDALRKGGMTIEKEMMNNAIIAGITIFPLSIIFFSFIGYLFLN